MLRLRTEDRAINLLSEMRVSAVALALAAASLDVALASESMICVEEISGGLKIVDGQWQGVKFRVDGAKYLVSPTAAGSTSYEVKELGENYPLHRCERRKFDDGSLAEQMVCGGLGYGMLVNFEKLRFVQIYTLGFIEDDRTGSNTPSVTGGKCATFER